MNSTLHYNTKILSIPKSWTTFLYHLKNQELDQIQVTGFFEQNWMITIWIAMGYISIIFYGQARMKDRLPFNLRTPLVLWSGFLCIFSLIGSIVVLPEFYRTYKNHGFIATFCSDSFRHEKHVFYWYTYFTLSKVLELIDTLFIVLRKQKLIQLHWVHHALTMCFTFFTASNPPGTTRYMVGMNFAIHTIMYGYYCLTAMRIRIPRIISIMITGGQIAQMIMGLYIHSYVLMSIIFGFDSCDCSTRHCIAGFLVYALYFYYFVSFFVEKYVTGSGRHKQSAKQMDKPMIDTGSTPEHTTNKIIDLNNNNGLRMKSE